MGVISGAGAAPPPGTEAFAALPEETQPGISPDGHRLAWFERKPPQPGVVVFDLGTRKTLRIVAIPANSTLSSLYWQSNETLLLAVQDAGAGVVEGSRVVAADVNSGATRALTSPGGLWSLGKYLVAARTSRPDTAIIATSPPRRLNLGHTVGNTQLMEIDVRTGRSAVIKEGGDRTIRWFVDRDGHPLAREDWEWLQNRYCVYALGAKSKRELLCRDDADPPILSGTLADGSALVLLATNGRSRQAAWALPLDRSPLRLLAEIPDADVTNVFLDPYTGAVIGAYASGSEARVRWLDAAAERRYESLARVFPGRVVEPYDWTSDGTKTLARVSSASAPPVYYLSDLNTHKADIAAESYPGLSGVTMGDVREIRYRSRDGTDIPAYLATPPGGKAPFPLVVLPHGGPNQRDFLLFDPLVQFLATRGYAVLQPQFRGSSGFGNAFRDAGDRQWGGLMQDDVTDGVRAMVAQQLADPHRICIVGTTPYGGYVALAGAAFTPELYECAVSINGVSDLPAYVTALLPAAGAHIVSSSGVALVEKRIGKPHDPELKARSPVNAAASIRAHILIVYSGNTGVLPLQSTNMARALSAAGKDVSVDTLPADAWSNSRARVQIFEELARFLGQYLLAN
ncbi:MAG TPA: prolyl oligopeptidase family serine peptidase [Steroidobacteraceae bacterium]|nr:prolyl oligopeptidase family serine peptidase [Steroidobacteraceae bacterium]